VHLLPDAPAPMEPAAGVDLLGVGETSVPTVIPVVINACDAATGSRFDRLPHPI
jgi:CO/xanthine dehydrogenase Mo-binding subunit